MFEPQTPFQHKIRDRYYSGAELRELILSSFPPGEQAEYPQGPLQKVSFQGLVSIANSILSGRSFSENYKATQFAAVTREEILKRLIADKHYGTYGWIKIGEIPPAGQNRLILTTFDYIMSAEHYALRK